MTAPRIEIVIDELVVRGLSPEQARAAAGSLEARLAVLAGQSDASVPERAEASRRLPAIETTAGSLGDSVAAAVWGALAPSAGGER